MKKLMIMLGSIFFIALATNAQPQIEKSEEITQNEVPVVVLKSFERDFLSHGGLDVDGKWTVQYGFVKNEEGMDIPDPNTYTFTLKTKKGDNPVVVSYLPNGETEEAIGLTEFRKNTPDEKD